MVKSEYKEFGIYRITNIISGKTYIGKTGKNFGERWNCHRAQLNGGYHDNPYLQRAWNKYGGNSFEFAVVEVVDNVLKLNELEIKYIKKYKDMGLSYNILEGGDGGFLLGSHLSEDAKKRIGEKNRRNMTGKKASMETRKKMSDSHTRRYEAWTDAERRAYGEKMSKCASGYHWSKESKDRFSELQQTKPNGAVLSVETVREIRRLYEQDKKSFTEISDLLNIPRHNVYMIATYRRWANA